MSLGKFVHLKLVGLQNLNAIKSIAQWQKIEYQFELHKLSYDTDIELVVLSKGSSIMSQVLHCKLVLAPTSALKMPSVLPPLQSFSQIFSEI